MAFTITVSECLNIFNVLILTAFFWGTMMLFSPFTYWGQKQRDYDSDLQTALHAAKCSNAVPKFLAPGSPWWTP